MVWMSRWKLAISLGSVGYVTPIHPLEVGERTHLILTIDPSQPNTTSKLGDSSFEGRFSMYQWVLKFVEDLDDTPTKFWIEDEVGICFEICF